MKITAAISFPIVATPCMNPNLMHALMDYNGGLEKAILRDSEFLSEVNDAFCNC